MSSENNNSDSENNGTSGASIDFDTFHTYFSKNPDLDNAEYYQKFPDVNPGTIRSWKARAKKDIKTEPSQTPSTPSDPPLANEEVKRLKGDLIAALIEKTQFNEELLNGLDEDSQLKLLKNANEHTPKDPNIRMFTPSATGKQELGLEKFMIMDTKSFKEKGFGAVEVVLPASILHDPNKSEDLKKFK